MVLTYASEALHVQQLAEMKGRRRITLEKERFPLASLRWDRCCSEWVCWTFERTCGGVANLFCARVTQRPAARGSLGAHYENKWSRKTARSREQTYHVQKVCQISVSHEIIPTEVLKYFYVP